MCNVLKLYQTCKHTLACMHSRMQWSVDKFLSIRGRALRTQRVRAGSAAAATWNRGRSHKNAICRYTLSDVCWQCVVMHIMIRTATVEKAFFLFPKTRKIESSTKCMNVRKWQAVRSQNWLRDLAVNRSDPGCCSMHATLRIMWNHLSGGTFSPFSSRLRKMGDEGWERERERIRTTKLDFICMRPQFLQRNGWH